MILAFIALIISICLFVLTLRNAKDKERTRVLLAKYSSEVDVFNKSFAKLCTHYVSNTETERIKEGWRELYQDKKPQNFFCKYFI